MFFVWITVDFLPNVDRSDIPLSTLRVNTRTRLTSISWQQPARLWPQTFPRAHPVSRAPLFLAVLMGGGSVLGAIELDRTNEPERTSSHAPVLARSLLI